MLIRILFRDIADQPITWEIEFYPKGVKYGRAKMVWGEDVPEVSLNTVRLRVTCRYPQIEEQRFKVKILLSNLPTWLNVYFQITDCCAHYGCSE